MSEAEKAALEAAREILEELFPDSPIMDGEDMKHEEEAARVSDWNRIANGEATAEQIQSENSVFTLDQVRTFKICNLEQALAELE